MAVIFMGTGGSSGRTLAAAAAALPEDLAGQPIRFVDTQPFNLRTGGTTAYDGPGEVRRADPDACGLKRHTSSWSANMLLNGGQAMYRRMIAYAAGLIGADADVIVTCHDRIYIETAMLHAARRQGAATVLLQEGPFCAIGHGAPRSRLLRAKALAAPLATRLLRVLPPIPEYGMAGHDRVIAASDSYRARWIAAGLAPETVVVGGIPRFDPLATLRGAARPAVAPLRVLYLVQPFAAHGKVDTAAAHAAQRALAEGLNAAAARRPIALTIRSHPRSSGDDAGVLRGALAFAAAEDRGAAPLEAVLPETDLVIGHYSSGMLEALLAQRPVACVPVPAAAFAEAAEADKQIWLTRIGIPVATNAGEIAAVLAQAGAMPATVDWGRIGEEVGTVDGHAAARCAELIAEVVRRRAR
ncbi:hypothetical protein [Sphingomonas sp. NFR15]|uniref:hypothetical protein n=1 Tax=Sphingomonas sp. NFR15 TaxID=1566282 RepID=UPI000B86B1E5|nr:hypothetical protein [Sphingomonas sp. NFR15]